MKSPKTTDETTKVKPNPKVKAASMPKSKYTKPKALTTSKKNKSILSKIHKI